MILMNAYDPGSFFRHYLSSRWLERLEKIQGLNGDLRKKNYPREKKNESATCTPVNIVEWGQDEISQITRNHEAKWPSG